MTKITVQVTINAPLDKVWELMNAPEAIEQWNQASPDWHCLNAENNLIVGGSLKSTMAAKDGSFAFDFEGIYNEIVPFKLIRYHLLDQRMVTVVFKENNKQVTVTETFDAESENSHEMQKQGWQEILNSFKNFVENN